MSASINTFQANDGKTVCWRLWTPASQTAPVGTVHILHGMAEHGGRYDRFASFLCDAGFVVFAQDHRGHGLTATRNHDPLGFFADHDGWERVVQDSVALDDVLEARYPGVPRFLLGHSMGSFLARTIMASRGDRFAGAVVMGTGCGKGLAGKVGLSLAEARVRRYGTRHVDPFLDKLCFGSYLKHVDHPRTPSDWLSRDPAAVDAYRADPLCGFVCTSSFYRDLIGGMTAANDPAQERKVPGDLPVLLISGGEDPVGGWGRGVRKVWEQYRHAGVKDLTIRLVPGARHEVLNETDKEDTMRYLRSWFTDRI